MLRNTLAAPVAGALLSVASPSPSSTLPVTPKVDSARYLSQTLQLYPRYIHDVPQVTALPTEVAEQRRIRLGDGTGTTYAAAAIGLRRPCRVSVFFDDCVGATHLESLQSILEAARPREEQAKQEVERLYRESADLRRRWSEDTGRWCRRKIELRKYIQILTRQLPSSANGVMLPIVPNDTPPSIYATNASLSQPPSPFPGLAPESQLPTQPQSPASHSHPGSQPPGSIHGPLSPFTQQGFPIVHSWHQRMQRGQERWPCLLQLLHILQYSAVTTFSVVVTAVFWVPLHPLPLSLPPLWRVHPDEKELPWVMLALVATAIHCAIKERTDGTCTPGLFTVYWQTSIPLLIQLLGIPDIDLSLMLI
ncbi:hypothetical protein FIBSPDRAFT_902667 [Athelia psychrophila]|uniref:DUF6532 domain-containing protein n=1 Tax=Athelia psychrophila TaxID=1759441 RepID=A0A167WYN2_9AGAM|nr:hypothetical protein FIBSPDRAFT_902667 [Fibularhizoctonia sp. CBS 109695]